LEANSAANINCREGTVRFWFKPDWTSQTNGPQSQARLIELGTKSSTNGWWALVLNSTGTNLSFCTQTNDTGTLKTNLTGAISWSYDWHQIVLTYCSTNSSLYIDGQSVVTTGLGVTNWPALSVRTNGFPYRKRRRGHESGARPVRKSGDIQLCPERGDDLKQLCHPPVIQRWI